ncbi:N6-L-threonylcarbamoyladenine synthase [Natronincola peptidivorans]|uniref:N(6)-L-threonylcarbamoyladenine synthase n=1 Tax=Natronincola peptidivorans TaxID=426128 RepID=A0A1H9YQC9_9FIRM|nr:O-sialoglycoprotein endopeptidase [Natronincola peptidivorans]SES70853.1 N6-L-threonylcarbamoyladenine synthase [Natronincola peptidivorans]
MNKEAAILGIDTSNYTTSLALITLEDELLVDKRKLLPVKEGLLGLRQSEAVFNHIKELPLLAKAISKENSRFEIVAISSATKPRPLPDSYMPVFIAAESFGYTMSNLFHVPFYKFSHQEGHIQAGLWSLSLKLKRPFFALHISGGTTELLKVIPKEVGYKIDILGSSSDISAGQFIDRIGVKLKLPFPAGAHMEALINKEIVDHVNIPVSVKNNSISFSGPETYIQRKLKENIKDDLIAYSVFQCVGKSLYQLIKNASTQDTCRDILLVGGVASNKIIREYLSEKLNQEAFKTYFALPNYCSDNAVGIASLGVECFKHKVDGN